MQASVTEPSAPFERGISPRLACRASRGPAHAHTAHPQLARCTVPGFPNEPAVKRGTRGGLGKAAITSVFIVISLPSRPNRRN